MQVFGEVEGVEKLAVDAVANPGVLFEGLDVDVRGAFPYRLFDDLVYELYDRRVVGVGLAHGLGEVEVAHGGVHEFEAGVFHGLLDAVEPFEVPLDFRRRGDTHFDVHAGEHAYFVLGYDVQRVGHGNQKGIAVLDGEGDGMEAPGHVFRNHPEGFRHGPVPGQGVNLELQQRAECVEEFSLGEGTVFDQRLTEPQAGGFLLDKGFIELFRCNGSRFNEKIPESCSFGHVIYRPPFLDSFILKMIAQEP